MKPMNIAKKYGAKVVTAATPLLFTAMVYAGDAADAISTESAGLKADLVTVGGLVVGVVCVIIAFCAAIGLFRKAK